ncbi:MAG: hypothetical protein GDA56_03105 [Hormoscilla sp. GM7CHS1pb]|nr:hypothetical protein [Hormoscilla sp. GM7CHS1pb]
MIEITFASGDCPSFYNSVKNNKHVNIAKPTPVFIMPIPYDRELGFLKKLSNSTILPPNPRDAVRTIKQRFANK